MELMTNENAKEKIYILVLKSTTLDAWKAWLHISTTKGPTIETKIQLSHIVLTNELRMGEGWLVMNGLVLPSF